MTMRTPLYLMVLLFAVSCNNQQQEPIPQYSIEQFYENTRIGGGYFSTDETKLLVSNNESGIFNVYEIDIKSGEMKQLTHSDEDSYFAVGYVPTTDEILYSADRGGNEKNHIFLLNSDGESVDLTPGEDEKAQFGGWNADKTAFYYVSNKRDPRYFDLYKTHTNDWQPEIIYQNEEGLDVTGISRDEKILALSRPITSSTNQLYLHNTETGKVTEISDPEKPGTFNSSGFSND